ncbi:MAG: indolepyruvate oxidoreductase subunit beta family protein [Burkholderiaceae bacterium]
MPAPRSLSLLIAALGGEGGGVLSDWIVQCALRCGLPVQATSVPGVAQRTGSTSYYLELLTEPAPAGAKPVFALSPVPGDVDVVLSSELLETARSLERGFVQPQRTTLISATHRVYTTLEKMQMGDGRFDSERVHASARALAARYLPLDMAAIAARHGTVISAVMFGALAGAGVLPWPRALCEQVIRDGGLGVEASLAGFAQACDTVATADARRTLADADLAAGERHGAGFADSWATELARLPAAMREHAAHGIARLVDYQDEAWARRYLQRLHRLAAASTQVPVGTPLAAPTRDRTLAEAARWLALWMSYEDVIRVADLKTRRSRFERIRAEAGAREDEIVDVVEFLKPGIDELAAIAPRGLGGWLRDRAERRGTLQRSFGGLRLASTHVHGFMMLRMLAMLRPLRPRSLRFHDENTAIDGWLDALGTLLATPAGEPLAELPRLIKGYGDTYRRGRARYQRIVDTLVAPMLRGERTPDAAGAAELRAAIDAALADPDGLGLERRLQAAGIAPLPPGFKPVHWVRKPRDRSTA